MFKLCPCILELHRADLNVLTRDKNLLVVAFLICPVLFEIYAVGASELDGLHHLQGLCLKELNLTILLQETVTHPSHQFGRTVVE